MPAGTVRPPQAGILPPFNRKIEHLRPFKPYRETKQVQLYESMQSGNMSLCTFLCILRAEPSGDKWLRLCGNMRRESEIPVPSAASFRFLRRLRFSDRFSLTGLCHPFPILHKTDCLFAFVSIFQHPFSDI